MQSNGPFPDTPSQPHLALLSDQREANERLLLAALSAQQDAEDARSARSATREGRLARPPHRGQRGPQHHFFFQLAAAVA